MLSITSEAMAAAGQNYTLICTASRLQALSVTPEITWLNPAGNELDSGDEITITVLTTTNKTVARLDFNPLKASNGGQYTCRAILESNAALLPLNKTTTLSVVVQCKFSYSITSADTRQSSSTLEVFITLYVFLLFCSSSSHCNPVCITKWYHLQWKYLTPNMYSSDKCRNRHCCCC